MDISWARQASVIESSDLSIEKHQMIFLRRALNGLVQLFINVTKLGAEKVFQVFKLIKMIPDKTVLGLALVRLLIKQIMPRWLHQRTCHVGDFCASESFKSH